jgi:hypothetical protein
VVHALGAGSDAATPWLRTFVLITGAPILMLFVHRVAVRRPARRVVQAAEGAPP